MLDFVKVGKRIADRRREMGLSQDELAGKLYVTRQAVSKWEKGLSVPSIDTLAELCRLFGVSFEALLGLFEGDKIKPDADDIFSGHDRSYVLERIASGEIKLNIADVLYQMSPAERMYILKSIRDGKIKAHKRELWAKLTPSEQRFLGGTEYEIRKGNNRRKRIL